MTDIEVASPGFWLDRLTTRQPMSRSRSLARVLAALWIGEMATYDARARDLDRVSARQT